MSTTIREGMGVWCVVGILTQILVRAVEGIIEGARVTALKRWVFATAEYFKQGGKLAGPGGAELSFADNTYEY